MRIGIDARLAAAPRTGIGSYTANLARGARADRRAGAVRALHRRAARAAPGPALREHRAPGEAAPPLDLRRAPGRPAGARGSTSSTGRRTSSCPAFAGCPLVATVHDLIPLRCPGAVSRRFRLLFRRADRPRAAGGAPRDDGRRVHAARDPRALPRRRRTRSSTCRSPPARPSPPTPTRRDGGGCARATASPGATCSSSASSSRARTSRCSSTPSRSSGATYPHGPAFQLALAGGAGWRGEEIAAAVRRRGLEPAVRLLGYVPDEDLPWLYRGAELAVVPSQYEGFGLSALEAMACGTPVLAADAASLPEVVGDAGELFAPGDPALLARRIAEITAAPERLAAMRERGLARAAGFTWDRTARRVLEVYREAAAHERRPAQRRGVSREHRHRRPQGGRLRHRHARAQPRAPPGAPRPLGRVGPLPPPRRRGAAPRGRAGPAGAGALRAATRSAS